MCARQDPTSPRVAQRGKASFCSHADRENAPSCKQELLLTTEVVTLVLAETANVSGPHVCGERELSQIKAMKKSTAHVWPSAGGRAARLVGCTLVRPPWTASQLRPESGRPPLAQQVLATTFQ